MLYSTQLLVTAVLDVVVLTLTVVYAKSLPTAPISFAIIVAPVPVLQFEYAQTLNL